MFHIDATFEDIRIIADMVQEEGKPTFWRTCSNDNLTGATIYKDVTSEQMESILALNFALLNYNNLQNNPNQHS